MTAFLSRLLGCLPLLWFAFGLGVLSSTTRGYDEPTHARLTYDGAFVSAFGYDPASIPSANEWENRTVGMGGAFVDLAEFLAAERTAVQLEFPFARGASIQTPGVTTAGETFVRVGATPERLNFSFNGAGGALPRTYAMPEATFNAIGRDPAALQSLLDLPGSAPVYYRYLQPPPGTLIQRGIVPGGEFGGVGGVPEVRFPRGF